MPSATSSNLKLQLRRIIGRFKFEELEEAVLPSFPELTWNKLRSSLMKHHQNFTVNASIHVIEQTIEGANIGDNDLSDRLATLELIDTSRHSTRRVWTCHELRGIKNLPDFQSDEEIEERLSEAFMTNDQRMDVRVISHDNITFISVKEPKSKKRQTRKILPTFFAFSSGQEYFFTSKKSPPKTYLISITQGLGYTDHKLAKLSGRDLKSLYQLLWAKQQATLNNDNILTPPVYTGLKPAVRNTGIDFTESEQKGKYVDKCFGIEPPSTQSLHLTFVNQTWKCTELVPEIEDEHIDVRWEFDSRCIPSMIKKLVQRRVMRMPLPVYAENMLTIGRNEMTLRS